MDAMPAEKSQLTEADREREKQLASILPDRVVCEPGQPMGINFHLRGGVVQFQEFPPDILLEHLRTNWEKVRANFLAFETERVTVEGEITWRTAQLNGLTKAGINIPRADVETLSACKARSTALRAKIMIAQKYQTAMLKKIKAVDAALRP